MAAVERAFDAHIFGAVHGRDLVILNIVSGEYDLYTGLADHIALSQDRRALRSADEAVLGALSDLGLFGAGTGSRARGIPDLPSSTALYRPEPPMRSRDRLWVARGWADMIGLYHGRPFRDLIDTARRRLPARGAPDLAALRRQAAIFDRLSVWLPFQGECLYRCFLLLRLLGEDAAHVDWVFGVRTWPFLAHCWLQSQGMALTDDADRLVMFSPILAV